jgi:hypothetical protein
MTDNMRGAAKAEALTLSSEILRVPALRLPTLRGFTLHESQRPHEECRCDFQIWML